MSVTVTGHVAPMPDIRDFQMELDTPAMQPEPLLAQAELPKGWEMIGVDYFITEIKLIFKKMDSFIEMCRWTAYGP